MKIIKRTDRGDLVVFAGDKLTLEGQLVTGYGWSYEAPLNWVMVMEDATLPDGYVPSGWTYTNGVWTINSTGSASILPGKRRDKMAVLRDAADEANYAVLTYNGYDWDTDEQSRDLRSQVLSAGSVPVDMTWPDTDGVQRSVTYQQLKEMAYALVVRALAVNSNLAAKKAEVNAATTAEAIDAVTW